MHVVWCSESEPTQTIPIPLNYNKFHQIYNVLRFNVSNVIAKYL